MELGTRWSFGEIRPSLERKSAAGSDSVHGEVCPHRDYVRRWAVRANQCVVLTLGSRGIVRFTPIRRGEGNREHLDQQWMRGLARAIAQCCRLSFADTRTACHGSERLSHVDASSPDEDCPPLSAAAACLFHMTCSKIAIGLFPTSAAIRARISLSSAMMGSRSVSSTSASAS